MSSEQQESSDLNKAVAFVIKHLGNLQIAAAVMLVAYLVFEFLSSL